MKWKWPEAAQRWKGALRRYQYVLLVIAVGAVLLLLPGTNPDLGAREWDRIGLVR